MKYFICFLFIYFILLLVLCCSMVQGRTIFQSKVFPFQVDCATSNIVEELEQGLFLFTSKPKVIWFRVKPDLCIM